MEYPLYLPGRSPTVLRVEGQRQVAFPYVPEAPFPLPTLFCFARPVCREGKTWLIFSFDGNGLPIFS